MASGAQSRRRGYRIRRKLAASKSTGTKSIAVTKIEQPPESEISKYDTPFNFGRTLRIRSEDGTSNIEFHPILSVQRYATVLQVIRDFAEKHTVKIITEFGSGSFQFFYRYAQTLHFLETLNEIDIDAERISSALHVVSSIRYREYTRKSPLVVNVFHGNCAEKDRRTIPTDIVIGIEIIEHLNAEDFDAFPRNVFGYIKPKLAVFTTPNYDYNGFFKNGGQFRHDDHKFEFTNRECQSWASKIVVEFPDYTFKIYGIGDPPGIDLEKNNQDLIFCSQMVIFTRISDTNAVSTDELNYKLIGSFS